MLSAESCQTPTWRQLPNTCCSERGTPQGGDSTRAAFGVPQGCIVRNTFLEWQEIEDETSPWLEGGAGGAQRQVEPAAGVVEKVLRRRAQSCPEEALLATEGLGPEDQQQQQEPQQQRQQHYWQRQQQQQRGQSPQLSQQSSLPQQQQRWPGEHGRVLHTDFGGRQNQKVTDSDSAWSRLADAEECQDGGVECGRRPQPSAMDENRPHWSMGYSPTPTRSPGGKFSEHDQDVMSWYGNRSPQSTSAGGQSPGSRESTSQKSQKGSAPGKQLATSLILRGLPFNCTVDDVVSFIEQAGALEFLAPVLKPIALLSNPQGRPSGFAEVQLIKTANYHEVFGKLNMQTLGGRYIEVLTPRGNKAVHWATTSSRQGVGGGKQRDQKDSWRRPARPELRTGFSY